MILAEKISTKLRNECMLSDEAQVQEYIMNRKRQILEKHYNEVCKLYRPGEGGQTYFMTKLTPKDRKHAGKIYAKTQQELEEKIIAYYLQLEIDSRLTVRAVLNKALGNLKNKQNKTGIRTMQRFDKHLSSLGDIPISELSETSIRNALDKIITGDSKITEKEFNQTVTCLNKIASYCAYEHIAVCDIREIIKSWRDFKLTQKHIFKPVATKTKDQAFNKSEASRIVNYVLSNLTYKGLAIALLITTGLRVGEILALQMKDIHLEDGYLWIHQMEDTKTYKLLDYVKENKPREVFLSSEAEIVIKACIAFRMQDASDSPYLFLNPNSSDGKLHLRAIDAYLRDFIHPNVLDLPIDGEHPARSAHDCRRTYASLEYLNGTDIFTLSKQMGHSCAEQTWDYIRDIVEVSEKRERLKGCGLSLSCA